MPKVYGGGLASVEGMPIVTILGVGAEVSEGKTSGHFICSINPPGPEMMINGSVTSAKFEGDRVTLKGTDRNWGDFTVTLGPSKRLNLNWTNPFGPNKDTGLTEVETELSILRIER